MSWLTVVGKQRFFMQLAASAVLLVLVFLAIYFFFPIANDYYYYYFPVAKQWLAGTPSLQGNAGNVLVYPPWTVIFLVIPLGLPSTLTLGSAILTFTTMLLLLVSIYMFLQIFPAPRYAVVLAIANLFTVELLLMGQLDAFTLFGMMLCWQAERKRLPWLMALGFCLLALKPYNVILFGMVVLFAIRRWQISDLVKALSLPIVMIFSSIGITMFFAPNIWSELFGPTNEIVSETSIVIWSGLEQLGLPSLPFVFLAIIAVLAALRLAWRDGLTARVVAIVMSTTFVFTPYAHADYYVLLIPPFIYVARYSKPPAILAFILSFTPLLRIPAGKSISWISVAYPALLLCAAWLLPDDAIQEKGQKRVSSTQSTDASM